MNTRNILIITAILAALGAYLVFRSHRPVVEVTQVEPATMVAIPPSVPSPRYRAIQTAPRTSIAIPASEHINRECGNFLNMIRAIDLNAYLKGARHAIPEVAQCRELPDNLKTALENYHKECSPNTLDALKSQSAEKRFEMLSACFQALTLFRADLTEWLTRDQTVSKITDLKVLSDKLTARLINDPKTASEVAERLLELEPDLPNVSKTAAVTRFMDATARASGDSRNAAWNKVDDAVAMARKKNPNDPSLLELELVSGMLRNSDPTSLRNQVEGLKQTNRDISDYLLSWMDYRAGRPTEAIERLNGMLARGSKDPRVLETIGLIQQNQQEAFKISVQIPPDVVAPQPEEMPENESTPQ